MIESSSKKTTVTYQQICVREDYDLEANQKVVDVYGTKWYAMSASIFENYDVADGAPRKCFNFVNVRLISILKNGKAGNAFHEISFSRDQVTEATEGFKHFFDAYDKELAKASKGVKK